MNKKTIILPLLAVACCVTAWGQQAEAWTLRQCIDHAIANNIDIRKAMNAADQSAVEVNTAKWARLPDLSGSAGQNWSWGRAASPVDNTYSDMNNGSSRFDIGTSVPIFTGFQLPNQYALSKLDFKATMEDLNKAKEDIAINIASAYLQVLFKQELYKVAISQLELSKEQYARISRLAEVGKAASAEVAEAKARVAQGEMDVVQSDNNYRLQLLDLSQLLELPTPEGFSLAQPDTALVFAALTPPDEIYSEAMTNKPGIRAAQLRLEGSDKNIRIAQSAFYPTLN